MPKSLFGVIRRYGPLCHAREPLEAQPEWEAHRAFMNASEANGLARLAGPVEGRDKVLLICRAENEEGINRTWHPPRGANPPSSQQSDCLLQPASWRSRLK